MAYIQPDSDIKILKGVPLDKDYNHSLLFQQNTQGLIDQYNTFAPLAKYTLSNYSYQRYEKGAIRVQIPIANLYDCNYMMFKNSAYDSKWFYAFITQCEYVNDNTTTIHYQLDELQSWWADFDVGQCYVIREHSETDEIGDNVLPEPFTISEYVPLSYYDINYTQFALLIFYTSFDMSIVRDSITGNIVAQALGDPKFNGMMQNGIYAGFRYFYVGTLDIISHNNQTALFTDCSQALNLMVDNAINIISIVMCPRHIFDNWTNDWKDPSAYSFNISLHNKSKNGSKLYTPKNNKMFTYPFKQLTVTNFGGEEKNLKWESFSNPRVATFNLSENFVPRPEAIIYPTNYLGLTQNYEQLIILNDFPESAWSEDTYSKWWAQNRDVTIFNTLIAEIGAMAGAIAGSYVGGAGRVMAEGASGALSMLPIDTMLKMYHTPDDFKGKIDSTGFKLVNGKYGFRLYDMGVDYDTAITIDNYFSVYGYATNKVKYPNVFTQLHIRPHWNYIQAENVHLHPATTKGLPCDSEEVITKILNKGITFWNNINEVGNYSLDNSPQV